MIVIFTIIGLSIFGLNISNAKQGAMSQYNLQATNVAEMGPSQLREKIYSLLNSPSYQDKSLSDIKVQLQTDLNAAFTANYPILPNRANPNFKIINLTVSTSANGSNDTINVDFTSIGTAANNQTKTITGTIQINRMSAAPFPSQPIGVSFEQNPAPDIKQNTNLTYNNVYYNQDVSLAQNTNLTVSGDFYSSGNLSQENNSDIVVNGNAYINTISQKLNGGNNNGNQALICVDKTLYVYSTNTNPLSVKTDFKTCQDVKSYNNNQGIYAKNVVYYQNTPGQWLKSNIFTQNIQYK